MSSVSVFVENCSVDVRMFNKIEVLLKLLNILISVKCVESVLLYPQFTVMQVGSTIFVPISDLPSNRKIFFDWGFQMNYDMPFNISSFYMVPIWATNGSRNFFLNSRAVHEHDFTAKELYEGIENMIERYGYDRSCLKQSICELSQYPFDESYTNEISDVVNFLLKPSIHQGFSIDEKYEETLYRLAEDEGFAGKDCKQLHPRCKNSSLNIFTSADIPKVD